MELCEKLSIDGNHRPPSSYDGLDPSDNSNDSGLPRSNYNCIYKSSLCMFPSFMQAFETWFCVNLFCENVNNGW